MDAAIAAAADSIVDVGEGELGFECAGEVVNELGGGETFLVIGTAGTLPPSLFPTIFTEGEITRFALVVTVVVTVVVAVGVGVVPDDARVIVRVVVQLFLVPEEVQISFCIGTVLLCLDESQ